jgi:hypothetical protein
MRACAASGNDVNCAEYPVRGSKGQKAAMGTVDSGRARATTARCEVTEEEMPMERVAD